MRPHMMKLRCGLGFRRQGRGRKFGIGLLDLGFVTHSRTQSSNIRCSESRYFDEVFSALLGAMSGEQRKNFVLHGACNAGFTFANVHVYFSAHTELGQVDTRLD